MPLAPPPAAAQPPIARLPSPHPPLQLCTGARRRSHPTSCGPWYRSDPPRLLRSLAGGQPGGQAAQRRAHGPPHRGHCPPGSAPRPAAPPQPSSPPALPSGPALHRGQRPQARHHGWRPRLDLPRLQRSPAGRLARRAGGCLRPSTTRPAPKLRIVAGGPARCSCTQARVPLPSPS
ncbi:cyclin-K-like [Panicum virgatum]|uniref:cyclin-K-like n=1 Tax=Panicum virgatum TaxID=38727 RepID=UPI0019D60F59|nr:cyclin-K-like [Panicum virgatum]